MSLKKTKRGSTVHFPAKPDKFIFDNEVAEVFPEMAARSIPMYATAHKLHTDLLLRRHIPGSKLTVYDVGASRGHFFKTICNQLQIDHKTGAPWLDFHAIEESPDMLSYLIADLPWVHPVLGNISELGDFPEPADVVCMNYLLQFIETREARVAAIRWAYRNLKSGGMLLLGQKLKVSDTFADLFAYRYNKFRLDNGYTQEEIDAKTAALANSMWPVSSSEQEDLCYNNGFIDYVETTRWLQFSTAVCIKG